MVRSSGKLLGVAVVLAVLLVMLVSLTTPGIATRAQDNTPTPTAAPVTEISVTDVDGNAVLIKDTSRVITLGGSVTEIAYALGASEHIVAVDTSSLYPVEATKLPQVGYQRQLAAEGVIAQNPTLIIATTEAGPPEAIQQLKDSGITVLILPSEQSVDGIKAKITSIAQALSRVEEGATLIADLDADIAAAEAAKAQTTSHPKVMFIYARGASSISVAGMNNAANSMITLAGGINAVTDYEGYKPLTAEAAVAAAPDVILLLSLGIESIGGVDGVLELPGIAQTPAGQNKRVVAMDDLYLLGFGPRTGDAVLDLTYLLHEELPRTIPTTLRLEGKFTTVTRALEIAGQVDFFSGEGPYTFFAPTDEALAALPPGMLEGLLSSPISVQAVLSYHALDGKVAGADLLALDGKTVDTLFGQPLTVTVEDGTVILNGTIKVIQTDIAAATGVIHVIDAALIPSR